MKFEDVDFDFVECEELGFSAAQIAYIKDVVCEYMCRYPKLTLYRVCDYFYWDHAEEQLDEEHYTHNQEGELYQTRRELGQYCDDDKLIGFNHIRMSNMPLDNDKIASKVVEYKQRMEKLKREYERKRNKLVKRTGKELPSFDKVLSEGDNDYLTHHEINVKRLSMETFDIALIRFLEESNFIRRIVVHEIAHALAKSYGIENDPILIEMYSDNKDCFEDLSEFIAECFMASEFTNVIPLANSVRGVMDTYLKQ